MSYDYLIAGDGEKIIVENREIDTLPEGSTVIVGFDAENFMFFDAETEQRLR